MDTPRITGFQPNFGVGSLKNNQERRRGRAFENAFDKQGKKRGKGKERRRGEEGDIVELEAEVGAGAGTGVGSDDSDSGAGAGPITRTLQDREGIIRKDEEDDGLLHIDVVV